MGRVWRGIVGVVVMVGSAVCCPLARAELPGKPSPGTPEYMLNVPPAHRMTPWQTMLLLARKRMQDIRCLIPQAALKGNLQDPKGELCYRKNGMRICISSKLSFSPSNYSGGIFITNRPGECPF